jgi:predicted RNase H-like nuclease (RuvC/YqgF family)
MNNNNYTYNLEKRIDDLTDSITEKTERIEELEEFLHDIKPLLRLIEDSGNIISFLQTVLSESYNINFTDEIENNSCHYTKAYVFLNEICNTSRGTCEQITELMGESCDTDNEYNVD